MRVRGAVWVLLALPIVLAGGPARAESAEPAASVVADKWTPPRLSLSLDMGANFAAPEEYRLFSPDRADTVGGLTAAYDVLRFGGERGSLAAAASLGLEALDRAWGGATSHEARLDVATYSAAVIVRWAVRPWLEPQVRLAGGVAWGRAVLTMSDGQTFRGDDVSPEASISAGLRVRSHATRLGLSPRGPRIAFAVTVEGGYTVGAPLELRLAQSKPEGQRTDDRIPVEGTDIGSLGRARPTLRVSLALLF